MQCYGGFRGGRATTECQIFIIFTEFAENMYKFDIFSIKKKEKNPHMCQILGLPLKVGLSLTSPNILKFENANNYM